MKPRATDMSPRIGHMDNRTHICRSRTHICRSRTQNCRSLGTKQPLKLILIRPGLRLRAAGSPRYRKPDGAGHPHRPGRLT